jgi:formylglycine-generating enzyme required for sulfatase activity/predicted MPP superfamily phosphohydrolase
VASLTWLHLSDLHAGRPQWDSGRVTETLIADLKRLAAEGLRPDFLFFTGDAAWGRAEGAALESLDAQFDLAADLLTAARRAFEPELPLANVFLVPGNHDVDRTRVRPSQTSALGAMSLDQVHKWIESGNVEWETAMERLLAYRRFLARHGYEHLLDDPARLIYGCVREAAGVRVGIAGLNSAWSCCRDGENGDLWVGRAYQQGVLREPLREAAIRIALVHHPPGWLVEHEKTDFSRQLRQDFQFLLHGHEHQGWVEPPEGGGFVTVSGAACYERSDRKNGYNLVRLDLDSGRGEIWLREFKRTGGKWVKCVVPDWAENGIWQVELPWLAQPPAKRPSASSPAKPAPQAVPSAPATGLERDLGRYLERLRESTRYLPIAGFETRVRLRITLDEVYVPLRARVQHQVFEKEQRELGAAWQMGELEREADVALDSVFPLAIEKDRRGAVVLGDPGSGKTTLLKHFVQACTDPQLGPSALGLPAELGLVPILVELRRLREPAAGLRSALAEALALADIALETEASRLAGELIGRDRLFVLVDGLDEVADDELRAAVSSWLEEAIGQLPRSYFVLTSRYAGYRGDSRLDGRFLELHIRDLTEEEARRFIASWYQAVESQAELSAAPEVARRRAEEGAAELADRLFEADDRRTAELRNLVSNPLLLQIVCQVHRERKNLPERRVELYEECVKVLLETWRRAKKLPVELGAAQAQKLLQPLAWWFHSGERREASLAEILPVLAEPLRELGRPGEGEALLRAIRDQSGLLVFLGQGKWGFLHQSFQEYLAARHVQARVLDQELWKDLAGRFGEPWWREVLLLALGFDTPSLFRPLLGEIVRQKRLRRDPHLAADCLSDAAAPVAEPFLTALAAGLEPLEERYQVLYMLQRVPGWEAIEVDGVVAREIVAAAAAGLAGRSQEEAQLVQSIRSLAAELLGLPAPKPRRRGAAPAAGEELRHEPSGIVLVYVPGGVYTLGADDISDEEKPVHSVTLNPFWLGKYPVTNEQYGRFLAANPEARKPASWQDKRFNAPQQPVVGVSWEEAQAFCVWAGLALPSEAQWEAAARGADGRRYPWGNEVPTPERANYGRREGRTTPVGAYPLGAGPFGALDQAGNVWEWCEDVWASAAYRGRDGSVNPVSTKDDLAVRSLRGGSWNLEAGHLPAAWRFGGWALDRDQDFGFRCVSWSRPEP